MRPEARSLNLANSVAVLTYEALRQLGFPQLCGEGDRKAAPPLSCRVLTRHRGTAAGPEWNPDDPPTKMKRRGFFLMNYDKKTIRDIDVSGKKDPPAL